jgi:hypothetical protein
MRINRYTSSPVAMYNPLSINELAFAPTFLRQRHDQAAQSLSDLGIASGQYDVLDQYAPIASQLVDPLQNNINELASQLATQGINKSRAIPEAMKLKSQYSNLFGQSGGIGQLQSATKQYRDQIQQIQKFFEKNPELARGAIAELQAGQASLQDGRLQLGQMQTPNYVRHYDTKEINDILNSQIDNIKDTTLKSLGFSNVGSISSVQDVYRQGQIDGRTKEEITQILMSQLSPEVIQSARQYGRYALGDENAGLKSLQNQIEGAAAGRANQTLRDSYSIVGNDLKLYAAKKQMDAEMAIPFRMPTGRINDAATNPFADIKLDETGNINTEKLDPEYWRSQGQVVKRPDGSFEVFKLSGTGASKSKIFDSKVSQEFVQQTGQKFLDIKNSNPELAGLSNKEALERINQYQKNISQRADVAFMGTLDKPRKDALSNQVIAMMPNVSVYGPEGKGGTLDETVQQLGFKDYRDFAENGKDSFTGLTLFGPQGKPAYTYTVTGNDGKRTTMYVEADLNTQELAIRSTEINKMILNADIITPDASVNLSPNEIKNLNPEQSLQLKGFKPTQIINEKTGQSYPAFQISVNPIGTNASPYQISLTDLNLEGNKSYYELVSDFKKDIQGKPISEVKKILSNKYGLEYEENYIIQDFNTIQSNEEKTLLKSLPYLR